VAELKEWEHIGWREVPQLEGHCTAMQSVGERLALAKGLRQQQGEEVRKGCDHWQQEVEEPGSSVEELLGETELEGARIPWEEEEGELLQFVAHMENRRGVEEHLCLAGRGKEK
jgi:hypothetical protein